MATKKAGNKKIILYNTCAPNTASERFDVVRIKISARFHKTNTITNAANQRFILDFGLSNKIIKAMLKFIVKANIEGKAYTFITFYFAAQSIQTCLPPLILP